MPEPLRRHRRLLWALAAVVALVIAGTIAAVAWSWRWVSLPAPTEEIAARWRDVEAWAAPHGGSGPTDELLRAQRAVAGGPSPEDQGDGAPPPRLELATAPADVAEALAALERWYRAGGGLRTCDEDIAPLTLLRLGRWGLATASEGDLERARAVVHLAAVLRGVGTPVQAAVGVSLSREALRWSADRGVDRRTLGPGLPPRPGEAFDALARDPVCLLGLVSAPGVDEEGRFVPTIENREVATLQWYYGDLLARARPHREDVEALDAFLRREHDRLESDPPPSMLVRAAAGFRHARPWVDFEREWRAPSP